MEAIALLADSPLFLTFSTLLLGLLVGSFINVVAYRLPRMLQHEWHSQCDELLAERDGREAVDTAEPPGNLVTPRSRCPHCGHAIRAWENIPLLSYLWLRGRCSGCHGKISLRYPLVELSCGLLSAAVAWHFGFTIELLGALLLTWTLLALTLIDLDHQLLPDSITQPLLWGGLLFALFAAFATPIDAIIGAVAGYLSLWLVFHGFRLLTGKEGMGYGDFKLLAALGAWLGWQTLPLIILLSSLLGAVVGIALVVLRGHDRNIPIPFGPWLAAGGWLSLLWGEQILAWWL